ncbi:oligosaccharide flippase family protein [Parabacteroides sp.]
MRFGKNNKYKVIAHNTTYLSILEILKMVMPFVALPYLISTVGPDKYGLVVFAQAVISYFVIIVNFGLDVSAVKNVSINRNNNEKLSEVVSSVLLIKLCLFFFSFFILLLLLLCVKQFRANYLLFLLSFMSCLSEILFPAWFYQGIEKMKYITLIRFSSIFFYTVTVFIFIKGQSDYLLIPLLQSLGWILSGAISFFMLIRIEKISLFIPGFESVKKYFVESIPFFISRVSVVVNSNMAKTACGIFFSMHEVAAFDLAQKIAMTALIPLQMLNQAVFPHIAKTLDRLFVNKCFKFILLATCCIVVIVYLFAPIMVNILSNAELPGAVDILRVLCLFIFSGGITSYTGSPVLVSFGYAKPFNRSVILSTLVLIATYFCLYFTNSFSILNFAFALGFAEFVIAVYRLYYCNRYKLIKLYGGTSSF